MDNIKDVLLRETESCMKNLELYHTMARLGYTENVYWDTYHTAAGTICSIVGEDFKNYENTEVFTIIQTPILSIERRAEMLYALYKKHHAPQQLRVQDDILQPHIQKVDGGYLISERCLKQTADEMCARCGLCESNDARFKLTCNTCKWNPIRNGVFPGAKEEE